MTPPLTPNLERIAREIDALIANSERHDHAAATLRAASYDELLMLVDVAEEMNLTNLTTLVVDELNRR